MELYGRRAQYDVVNIMFAMNFVVFAPVWSIIATPAAGPDPAGQFADVFGTLLVSIVRQKGT
ncbi:hypothetical protein [Natronorubrum bangense]|uniref:hypothetical protein n=1 Tax=Natronorubrum bangense TaxID=61858 RepID=UPI001F0E6AA5|nr:hypothetical protein [Natronorubrum bangense]